MQQFQTFLSFLVLQHVFADVSEEEGKAFNFHEKQHKKRAGCEGALNVFCLLLPRLQSALSKPFKRKMEGLKVACDEGRNHHFDPTIALK